jgi:hypothetical protein
MKKSISALALAILAGLISTAVALAAPPPEHLHGIENACSRPNGVVVLHNKHCGF